PRRLRQTGVAVLQAPVGARCTVSGYHALGQSDHSAGQRLEGGFPRMSDQRQPGRFSRRELLNGALGLVPLSVVSGLIAACAPAAAPAAPKTSDAAPRA